MNYFGNGGSTISIYNTPESMQDKCDEYFETCFRVKRDRDGDPYIKVIKPPTYTGLARYLGFSSRSQMLNYKNDDARFDGVVQRAMMVIEEYVEGKLQDSKAPNGLMFILKNNAEWEEKTKRELSTENDKPLVFGWATGDTVETIDVADRKELATPVGEGHLLSTSQSEVVGIGSE